MRTLALVLLSLVSYGALGASVYDQAVAHEGRSVKDRERDARDLPGEVMEFAGIKPGMKVADVFGAGGYYSELLSYVVGPKGEVLLVNNPPYAKYGEEGMKERFTPGRLTNVKRITEPTDNLKLAPNSLDAIVMVMAYHDLYWVDDKEGWPKIDARQFLGQLSRALKPGGVLLLVDHAAKEGTGSSTTQELHRIDEKFARAAFEASGLKFVKSFDKLRNPQDDHAAPVFNPAIRGHTDRFVHLYRKP